jgi:enoyl-CoA hydratase/carnithine racemase
MSAVLVETVGAVQRLTINRPERRNALNATVVAGLIDGIRAAQATEGVRAIVLTGAGDRAFCAGGDLSPTADGAPMTVDPAHPHHVVVDLFKQMAACELPIIARVNGHALAGGLGLLCACDLAVAADHATFGMPEVKIGLFPMMILPQMLRVLPLRRLLELCMTGDAIAAAEAEAIGLVNAVVPAAGLDAGTDALVARVLRASPTALRLGKQALHAMRDMSLREGWEYAQLMLPMMARTGDAREGLLAFQEKRPPVWTGR